MKMNCDKCGYIKAACQCVTDTKKPLPCPFCWCELTQRRSKMSWQHPHGKCWLGGKIVYNEDVERWNTLTPDPVVMELVEHCECRPDLNTLSPDHSPYQISVWWGELKEILDRLPERYKR